MFSRTIGRISSWEFFAKAIAFLLVFDLLLMGPQFFRLFGVGGAIDRDILAVSTEQLPVSVWPLLKAWGLLAYGSQVLFGLFCAVALFATASTFLPRNPWLRVGLYASYVVLKQSIGLGTYGVHEFLQIALFYLTLWGVFGQPEPNGRVIALAFRVHLCIAYVFAGLSKSLGHQWWSGEAIWRSFNRSEGSGFRLFDLALLGDHVWLFQVIGWSTLFFETFYILSLWKPLRKVFIGSMIAMHLGILLFQGLLVFAPVMIVMNVFALLSAAEADRASEEPEDVPTRTEAFA